MSIESKVICNFWLCGGVGAPNPHIVQGSTVCSNWRSTDLDDFFRLLSAQWPRSQLYIRVTWRALKLSLRRRLWPRPMRPASLGVGPRHLCFLKAPQVTHVCSPVGEPLFHLEDSNQQNISPSSDLEGDWNGCSFFMVTHPHALFWPREH